VIEPLATHLAAIDQQRRGHYNGYDPDDRDKGEWTSFGQVCFHCEHDAHKTLTGDQHQRQDTGPTGIYTCILDLPLQ